MPARREPEPAPGGAWDVPIEEAPLAFVDLEMTGLDAAKDRVCEACVLRATGRHVEAEIETLVRPDVRAGGNVAIHGISAEDVAKAPAFAEIAPRVADLVRGAIVVAHGVTYDLALLRAEFDRVGGSIDIAGSVDTLTLSRRSFARSSHRLSTLAADLGIALERPHRAGDDARATMALFWKIVDVLAPRTPRDLFHVRVGEKHARPEILAAAIAAVEAGWPVTVKYRPSRRAPEDVAMVLTEVRTDRDPPHVTGYLVESRGRKELRADRILSIVPR